MENAAVTLPLTDTKEAREISIFDYLDQLSALIQKPFVAVGTKIHSATARAMEVAVRKPEYLDKLAYIQIRFLLEEILGSKSAKRSRIADLFSQN